jgi:hypothetical protein
LDVLNSIANDHCETATLGAIQAQAYRCYGYIKLFNDSNIDFTNRVKSSLMKETTYDNGSSIEVLTATVTGVNSPHPQRLFLDEVELINWFIMQQAFNMVQSKGVVKGQTVMGSTRKYVSGPMNRMIADMDKTGLKLYQWCIWEVMEQFPRNNPGLSQRIIEVFGEELPKNYKMMEGFYSWEDLLDKYVNIDRDIWETEWLCLRPQSGGLVYPRWSDEENVITDWKFNPSLKHYIWEDYGYAQDHPDVLLFIEVDPVKQSVVIFDEEYLTLQSTQQIIDRAKAKLAQYNLVVRGNDNQLSIDGWVGDPHGQTEWMDRFNQGAPMMGKMVRDELNGGWKIRYENNDLYQLKNSIPLVRKFIDERWLKVTPNVVGYRNEIMSYRKVRLPDGTYKDEPEKKNDHGPDASRYGMIMLFPAQAYASFGTTLKETQEIRNQEPIRSITAGLRGRKF